jgi:hypothetical protein
MVQVSLESIGNVDSLHKTDFYRLVAGQKCMFRFGSTEIPLLEQNVRPNNMGEIMTAVQKFEKRHGREGYYSGHIEKIREAFRADDYATFRHEIGELLVSIEWD